MDEFTKSIRREYQRAWRAAHKDRVRAYNSTYWTRKAQKLQEIQNQTGEKTEESHE